MNGIIIAMLAWWLGGFINGIVGFGAALVAMPIVALGNDMSLAVPSCGLVVLALNVQVAWSYRKHMNYPGIRPLVLGGLPGAFIGMLLLRYASESGLRLGLGILLVAYALWGLCSPRRRRHITLRPYWGVLTGMLSTSLGAAYGINGPPLAVYLSFRGGTQSETKAALGAFFIVSGIFVVAAQALAGVHSMRSTQLFLAALPAVVLGGFAGIRLSANLNDAWFHTGVFIMLLVMGGNMIRLSLF